MSSVQRTDVVYRPASSDADVAGYARVLAHAFGRAEPESQQWVGRFERSNLRVMSRGDEVLAGLILIEKGQFWGGRSVSMTGVSAVGVSPHARGHALATRLMAESLQEMRARGTALSALYPATQKLYRSVGYEQAGHRFETRIPLSRIDVRERSLSVRPLQDTDAPAVRDLYRRIAPMHAGNLDRVAINWDRIERPPPSRIDPARAFVVEQPESPRQAAGASTITGYIYLAQVAAGDRGKHEVHVQDMQASTPEAGRRLWAFLAGYGSMATEAAWFTGPLHPMLLQLGEQPYRIALRDFWMLRIVDVEKALAARGYPPGLTAALRVHVRDETLPANEGTYDLEVHEGRCMVARVGASPSRRHDARGADHLETSANGLACVYSGHVSASALRVAGLLGGSDSAIAAADAIFAGPAPWMTDMF